MFLDTFAVGCHAGYHCRLDERIADDGVAFLMASTTQLLLLNLNVMGAFFSKRRYSVLIVCVFCLENIESIYQLCIRPIKNSSRRSDSKMHVCPHAHAHSMFVS